MLLSILPKIAGIKVENPWLQGKRGMVSCLARLTRPLTSQEAVRLKKLLPVEEAEGNRVLYYCLPSQAEEWGEWLERSLVLAARPEAAKGLRRKGGRARHRRA